MKSYLPHRFANGNLSFDRKRRLFYSLLLLLLFSAPTPGSVGSCNEQDSALDFIDLRQYCEEKEQLVCYRRGLRDEIDDSEVIECRHQAIQTCEMRYWAPECRPTNRQAQACLNALKSSDTVNIDEEDIYECSKEALCTVETRSSPSPTSDAGDESQ